MNERIENILRLTTATPKDAKEIIHIHSTLFGKEIHICPTCPDQLRLAVKRIKKYYEST